MDKYDQLEDSVRDFEDEDYFYELERRYGVETKEEQIANCYRLRELDKFGSRL